MRSMTLRPAILLVLAAATAAGSASCAGRRPPDITQAVALAGTESPRPAMILIHGFMGSRLRDPHTHRVAWGTMANVLLGGDRDDLALAMDGRTDGVPGERLVPWQIYESLWGVDYYREALRSLEENGGYRIGDIHHPRPGDNAFVFLYDWRRDNVDSARQLAAAITRLKRLRGDPEERFDLVAHSLGGLVARYYIKYGSRDVLRDGAPFAPTMAGAPHVNRVILAGTPNQGCLEALRSLHRGIRKGFRPMRPEVVFTMPAVYQMLPPPGAAVFADSSGAPVHLDLYDPDTWERWGWSVFSPETQRRIARRLDDDDAALKRRNAQMRSFLEGRLRNARLFREALDAPEPEEARVQYHAFGGDCLSTRKAAIVAQRHGEPELLFDDDQIRSAAARDRVAAVLYAPGDGVVTTQSLLGVSGGADREHVNLDSSFFVCGQHGVLTNHPEFQDNLLQLLLKLEDPGRSRASLP